MKHNKIPLVKIISENDILLLGHNITVKPKIFRHTKVYLQKMIIDYPQR